MICQKLLRLGVSVLLIVAGCGKQPGTEPTEKVSGTVTYNGKPVSGASVGFFPEKGRAAAGMTDGEGKFTLSTFATGDGAVLGHHRVAISEVYKMPPKGSPEALNWTPPANPRFPAKYADPMKSGLSADVKGGEKNDFTFNLTGD